MSENRKKPNYFDENEPLSRQDKKKKRKHDKHDNEQETEGRKSKKKWIVWIVVLLFLAVIGVIIYMTASHKGADGQIDEFKKAVDNHDYDKISEISDSNKQEITPEDAKHFVAYINKDGNKERFNKEIKEIKKAVKKDGDDPELGAITDHNNKPIFEVTENGRRMLVLKELAFEPQFQNVYVKPDGQRYSYTFKNGGKERTYVSKTKKDTNIGKFFVGDYDLDTVKKFEDTLIDGKTNGKLHINTDNKAENGHIYATEQFPQSSFKIHLENEQKLKKNISLNINDKNTAYKKDKVYGKYPNEGHITVQAEGKIFDTTVKTQVEDIAPNQNDKPQEITLKFDKAEIEKAEEKEKSSKNSSRDFMERYTKALTHAYKRSDFKKVSSYFEDKNSPVAQNIKKQVESDRKSKYSDPKILSYDREGNKVTVVLSKEDEHHNTIKSKYILKKADVGDGYKIESYTDI